MKDGGKVWNGKAEVAQNTKLESDAKMGNYAKPKTTKSDKTVPGGKDSAEINIVTGLDLNLSLAPLYVLRGGLDLNCYPTEEDHISVGDCSLEGEGVGTSLFPPPPPRGVAREIRKPSCRK